MNNFDTIEHYSGKTKVYVPVPGIGPILHVRLWDGFVYATRSDGEKPVTWVCTENGGWKQETKDI